MKPRIHLMSTALAALVLSATAVGCAAEEPEDKPYVPQITHSPQEPADDENADEGKSIEPEVAEDVESGGSELEPPEIPDEIYENTLEGAEAAAKLYLETLSYALKHQDFDLLLDVCHPDSSTCKVHHEAIRNLDAKNRHIEGGTITYRDFTYHSGEKDEILFTFPVMQDKTVIYDAEGVEVGRTEKIETTSDLVMLFEDGKWLLRAYSSAGKE